VASGLLSAAPVVKVLCASAADVALRASAIVKIIVFGVMVFS
jgi:hypothetical protein